MVPGRCRERRRFPFGRRLPSAALGGRSAVSVHQQPTVAQVRERRDRAVPLARERDGRFARPVDGSEQRKCPGRGLSPPLATVPAKRRRPGQGVAPRAKQAGIVEMRLDPPERLEDGVPRDAGVEPIGMV